MASRRLEVVIAGDAGGAVRALGQVENRADRTGRSMQGLRRVGGALAGVFAGVQIGQFLRGAVGEAEEAQSAMRQTAAVIQSTGGTAGVTADHLVDLSGRLSELAGLDDELIQQGGNLLLTFQNIKAEGGIYDDALESALNMSAAMDTELQPNILAVGKALNNPIAGISRLTRMGVEFDQGQKDQIATMMYFGDVAGAQRIILEELAEEFGGAAEANKTATMAMTVAWDNIKESIGTILLPYMERASTAVAGLSEWFQTLPRSTQTAILALTGVTVAAGLLASVLNLSFWPVLAVVAAVAGLAAGLWYLGEQFPQAKDKAMEFFDSLPERWAEFQKDLKPVRESLEETFKGFKRFIKSLDFGGIKKNLGEIGDNLQDLKDQLGITSSNGQTAMMVLGGAFMFVSLTIQTTILAAMQAWTAITKVGAIGLKVLQYAILSVQAFLGGATSAAQTAWKAISSLSNLNVSVPGLGSLRDLLSSAADAAKRLWGTLTDLASRNFSISVDVPVLGNLGIGEASGVGGASLGGSVAMATGVRGGGNRRLSTASAGDTHVTLVMPDGQVLARTTVRGHRKDSRAYAGAGGGDY